MSNRKERGIHELFAADPARADREVFGRVSDPNGRRGFLKKSGLFTMMAVVGANIPFAEFMPEGMIPASVAYAQDGFVIPGKSPNLTILNDRPVNAETPAHLLNDDVTPGNLMFVRNNGIPPENIDPKTWTLTIDGEAMEGREVTYSIDDLKSKFKNYTYQIQIECGGNGRSEYNPPASGNQWTVGAVASPEFTGVRLKDVIKDAGVNMDKFVYTGFHGADTHPSGDPSKEPVSRGTPKYKAMEDESLIAWAMNGEDIPLMNGHPLRLVTGGWPGSTSGKWLNRISMRDRIHDGTKMGAPSYRVPCKPVAPGEDLAVNDSNFCIIESMPVKSLITSPKTGTKIKKGEKLKVHGHAWAGDERVKRLYVSIDFGATWQKAKLSKPVNRLAWQHFDAELEFPQTGYYEVWARAVDENDVSQPMVVPGWNPKGYVNNACHRVAIYVV